MMITYLRIFIIIIISFTVMLILIILSHHYNNKHNNIITHDTQKSHLFVQNKQSILQDKSKEKEHNISQQINALKELITVYKINNNLYKEYECLLELLIKYPKEINKADIITRIQNIGDYYDDEYKKTSKTFFSTINNKENKSIKIYNSLLKHVDLETELLLLLRTAKTLQYIQKSTTTTTETIVIVTDIYNQILTKINNNNNAMQINKIEIETYMELINFYIDINIRTVKQYYYNNNKNITIIISLLNKFQKKYPSDKEILKWINEQKLYINNEQAKKLLQLAKFYKDKNNIKVCNKYANLILKEHNNVNILYIEQAKKLLTNKKIH